MNLRSAVVIACLLAWTRFATAQPLPEGNTGIAANYPGDVGIETNSDVVFVEDFESVSGSSLATGASWAAVWGNLDITTSADNVHAGSRALEVIATEPVHSQGAQHDIVGGVDTLFVRYYMKYHPQFPGMHHSGIDLFSGAPGIGQGTSTGVHPNGTDSFQALLDTLSPTFSWGPPGNVPPGLLEVYCYHMDQAGGYGDVFYSTGEGNGNLALFGGTFVPRPKFTPERGRWYSFEVMLKANTPGSRDGRVAFWVDGVLAGDFPNLRFRSVDTLRINQLIITTYVSDLFPNQALWYDDIVAARSYIGPMTTTGSPGVDGGIGPDGATGGDAGGGGDGGDAASGGCGCNLGGPPPSSGLFVFVVAIALFGRRLLRGLHHDAG